MFIVIAIFTVNFYLDKRSAIKLSVGELKYLHE